MVNSRRFFKELGNLFYAIAAADKNISEKEKKALDDEVQFAWKHYDHTTDRFGTDRAFLIEFEFETMEDNDETAEVAYQAFETFFKENKDKYMSVMRHEMRLSGDSTDTSVNVMTKFAQKIAEKALESLKNKKLI